MAVKFAKAFGMHVTVFSTSANKEKEAREILGVDDFIVSKDTKAMDAAAKSIDFIINTASAQYSLDPFLKVLKTNGKMCLVGIPEKPLQVFPAMLTSGRQLIAGSATGELVKHKRC